MTGNTSASRKARLRVLVIDDMPAVRSVLRKMLGEIGFKEIFEASDGLAGLETLSRAAPDLIICDIEMKPMNGFKFMEALQARGYVGPNRIPALFVTSHGDRETVLKARGAGVDGFLIKPVQKVDLAARIDAVLMRMGIT